MKIIRKPNIISSKGKKNIIVDANFKNGLSVLRPLESICTHTFNLPKRN